MEIDTPGWLILESSVFMNKNTNNAKNEQSDNQFWKQALIAIADGYCSFNLTKNLIPGVMHQVIDGVDYDLNKQLGMPADIGPELQLMNQCLQKTI